MIQDLLQRPKADIMEIVKFLGADLLPNQEHVFLKVRDFAQSMVVTHPGWGKTSMVALLAFTYALMFPGRRIGCFTYSWEQSSIIYDYLREIIDKNEWVQPAIRECRKNGSRWTVRFNEAVGLNPSRIDSFSLHNASHLKGYRCHTVILDEAQDIPQEFFRFYFRPMVVTGSDPVSAMRYYTEKESIDNMRFLSIKMKMLALHDLETNYGGHQPMNQVIVFTGARHKGHYLYDFYQKWTEDPESFTATYPLRETPKGFVDTHVLREVKQEMSNSMWKAAYEGEWED